MTREDAERKEEALLDEVDARDAIIAEQREEIRQARKTGNYWKMELQEANKEIARLRDILCSADKDHAVEKLERQIARLQGLIKDAKSIAQMATSFKREDYPVMVDEAIAFLDKLTQEPT